MKKILYRIFLSVTVAKLLWRFKGYRKWFWKMQLRFSFFDLAQRGQLKTMFDMERFLTAMSELEKLEEED